MSVFITMVNRKLYAEKKKKKEGYFSCCYSIHLLQNIQHALLFLVYRYILHSTFLTKNNRETLPDNPGSPGGPGRPKPGRPGKKEIQLKMNI